MKVLVFPGQGSQYVGMGKDLFDLYPHYVEHASQLVGENIEKICLEDSDLLGDTLYTQPALYLTNYLSYLHYIENHSIPDCFLGHSLGEFNALLSAEVFDFETGFLLVKKRAELMSQCVDGAMLAVLGLTLCEVQAELNIHFADLDIANINSEKQVVISGGKKRIYEAASYFEKINIGVVPLKVSGAFHSRQMRESQEKFERYVLTVSFSSPKIPVIANCTAQPYQDNVTQLIVQQMSQPVKWFESVCYLLEHYDDNIEFIEIGPGKVLSNLITKIKKERQREVKNV